MTTETMWVIGILIAVASGSLGFGLSQMTIVSVVRGHEVEIRSIKEEMDKEAGRTDERIFKVVELVETSNRLVGKVVDQNTHLLAMQDARHRI